MGRQHRYYRPLGRNEKSREVGSKNRAGQRQWPVFPFDRLEVVPAQSLQDIPCFQR
jgi:hypothetical protein